MGNMQKIVFLGLFTGGAVRFPHFAHDLQGTGSPQIGQELDDVLGHRRRSGQVVASGLESVLIGHPIDGDHRAIGSGVRVRPAGHGANVLGFRSDLLLSATFFHFDTIARLEAAWRFQFCK